MQTFFELAVGVVAVIAIGIQIAVHKRPPTERAPSLNQAENVLPPAARGGIEGGKRCS